MNRSDHISIHCETAVKVNFACQQNAFAILRELTISHNASDQALEQLTVKLSSNPSFLKPKAWKLDRLGPKSRLAIHDRVIELDGNFLLQLTDAVSGTLRIEVEKNGEVLAALTRPVELLAFNEWGGAGYMPELLAAFVMPNDPAIDRILHEASHILRKAGKDDAIDGYRSQSRQRVWEIASAVYAAVCNWGLSYALPPASFERDGQKIRLPAQILEHRIGTCLDTTLLFAAVFEQAGLNPILFMTQDHAFAGVWLQPEELPAIVLEESETLRKRVALKELLAFETTCVTRHPALPFSKAIALTQEALAVDKEEFFRCAVDIRKARSQRITPLARKASAPVEGGVLALQTQVIEVALEAAPPLPNFKVLNETDAHNETPQGRLERWQRKLLDLSARNPLLNHRMNRTSLLLCCPDPGLLEDKLADGAAISIQSISKLGIATRDAALLRLPEGSSIATALAQAALEQKQVLVELPEDELLIRSVEIYRKTQTALQEGGANTLYLAIGFLLWKPRDKEDRRYRAPLILLPVTLERKSVRSGIKLLAHEDEPRFNATLLELLRKDFELEISGLYGELPSDSSGIDVAAIWDTVRRAVKEVPGFEVLEEVVLGHFSFAKYLMWKDLIDRGEMLRKSAVVNHLIESPRAAYPSETAFVDGSQLDRLYKPSDLLTPLPADASQMSAIATADRGKDFVIIGPPGTGKSQTIGNMIAHLLGKGKSVLFVSEKTAALEVVYRRLSDVGLDRFCLRLHSNKARKSDVHEQLQKAWSTRQNNGLEQWERASERLKQLRDQLNRVVERLHLRRRNGLTVHRAIGIKVRDEALTHGVKLHWPSADFHDEATLEAMRSAVEKLSIQAKAVGNFTEHPLQVVELGRWSPQWEGQLVERAGVCSAAAAELEQTCSQLLKALGIEISERSLNGLESLHELAQVLLGSWRQQTVFALEPDGVSRMEALEQVEGHLRHYKARQAQLSCPYEPLAWRKIDGAMLIMRWHQACNDWWPKRYFTRRAILKEFRLAGAQGVPDPAHDAPILKVLREEGTAIERLGRQLSSLKVWQEHNSDPDVLKKILEQGQRLRTAIGRLAGDAAAYVEIQRKLIDVLSSGNELLAPGASMARLAGDYVRDYKRFEEAISAFAALAGCLGDERYSRLPKRLDALKAAADNVIRHRAELNAWCGWRRRRTEALDLQLGPLVEAIEQGSLTADAIGETFEAAYCAWWSAIVISEDEVLRTFSVPEHLDSIYKFRRFDAQYLKLTAEYIQAKLSEQIPSADDVKRKSSWGVLAHELKKKARHKPVRKLFEEIPDVMLRLSPCLMMSPLSVAQYLPAHQELFDVVIFDEASQIAVWDAIGSLGRGRHAIVAGDPRQMPPTNFFARADDDPDDEFADEGDLESILDEMLGASIPQCTLNLHYRSRSESLIAFSNDRYYDNGLVTFPAPKHPDHAVSLVRPDGFYARGQARHNEGEAKAIVAEIVRRLLHPDSKISRRSIGVVTFNTQQQQLIENLLDEERARNPSLETAFSSELTLEPVFVKNLETVQGDERDVIFFSITFGPDRNGHVTMNFGPLNRDGGERRLNVAMTRAREEMLVYSMLKPEHIDLSRTRARAVKDLKHFLEYAERGSQALRNAVHGSLGDFESPFELAVARALREKGWIVHPQIGVSAYRIDLGIVHPDKVGVYLAGIECDGAMYHSSAYARERDKIRQSVLEGLGWKLLRVWSTEWWTHRVRALNHLHLTLQSLLDEERHLQAKSLEKSQSNL